HSREQLAAVTDGAADLRLLEQYRAECDTLAGALEQRDRAAVQGSAARLDALFHTLRGRYQAVATRPDMLEKLVESSRHETPAVAQHVLQMALSCWVPLQQTVATLPLEIAPQQDVRDGLHAIQEAMAEAVAVLLELYDRVEARDLAPLWERFHAACAVLREIQQKAQAVADLNQPLADPRRPGP
ncbi:MAG: hypothetical protein ACYCW6_26545, partial [Candidatus Xenobia bacterium]